MVLEIQAGRRDPLINTAAAVYPHTLHPPQLLNLSMPWRVHSSDRMLPLLQPSPWSIWGDLGVLTQGLCPPSTWY